MRSISPEVAKLNLDSVLDLRSRLADEISANFRWILATLVSINVAATIAVLSSQSLDKSTILIGGQWFCMGIIAAVFVGFFQIRGAAVGIKQIPDVLDFWIDAEQNGEIDLDRHKELRSRLSLAIIPWTVLTYLSGFGSLGCFVKGASEVGARLT